jgi:DNA-binding IclR family transcriptional regulator
MPARHHRTVDRIVAILEQIARHSDGMSLSELAGRLEAPKSSIQGLTNGLLATGYLVEQHGRLHLGSGPFMLSSSVPNLPIRKIHHDQVVAVHAKVGHIVLIGVRMGFEHVFIDHAGEDVETDYVLSIRPRRPLLRTATGKIILAHLPDTELVTILRQWARTEDDQHRAAEFLATRAEIRTTGLAYNDPDTPLGMDAVATPLYDPDGTFLAAVCATRGRDRDADMPTVGARLRDAVSDWVFN